MTFHNPGPTTPALYYGSEISGPGVSYMFGFGALSGIAIGNPTTITYDISSFGGIFQAGATYQFTIYLSNGQSFNETVVAK